MAKYVLQLENVTKKYDGIPVVSNLTARLSEGCIFGFLGPEGAGKTTVLRMILDIVKPDSGLVKVLGRTNISRLLPMMGYLPEERGAYGGMTVVQFLTYYGFLKRVSRRRLKHSIPRWIERVGLVQVADRKLESVSHAMRQRTLFVAAVMNAPKIVVFDDPFSNIDPVNFDILKAIMIRLRQQNKTVVLATHMLDRAEKLCDLVLLMNRGERIYDGTIGRLKSRYPANTVFLDMEGDPRIVSSLGMVEDVKPNAGKLEVLLNPQTDTQAFLRALVMKARVRSFEVKIPSLHEIFLDLSGRRR